MMSRGMRWGATLHRPLAGMLHSPASDHDRSGSFSPVGIDTGCYNGSSWRVWSTNATEFLFADPPLMLTITMVSVGIAR
jgi:hypothetical protein